MHKSAWWPRWVSLVASLLFTAMGMGQPAQNLFTHISVADGLNQRVANYVRQDNKGYIWIAAGNALQRYDGKQFVNFFTGNGGLPPGKISGLVIDKKNRVWIITDANKLGYMDADKLTYHPVRIDLPPITDLRNENGIFADEQGNIFMVLVGNAIITYNELRDEASQVYNPFTLPPSFHPLSIWQDKQSNYWIGTHEGLVKYNSAKKTLSYNGHNEDNDEVISKLGDVKTVNLVYIDNCHRFWLSAWPLEGHKVFTYNYDTRQLTFMNPYLSKVLRQYTELYEINETTGGRIWLSGVNAFVECNCGNEPLYNFPNDAVGEYSIKYDAVYDVFEDRERNVWVSTNRGVFRFNPTAQVFRTVPGRHPGIETTYSPDISNFLQTSAGELLVSTWGGSMFAYNKNYEPQPSAYVSTKPPAEEVLGWGMVQRKNGDIWWGHQGGWLTFFEGPSKHKRTIRLKEANAKTIRQLVEDKEGNIWMGTHGGDLIEWRAADSQFIVRQQFATTIHRLLFDTSGELWVCTEKRGAFRIDAKNNRIIANYTDSGEPAKRLLSNWCYDVMQYDDSTIILAAGGINTFNKRTGAFTYIKDAGTVMLIARDKKGNLWTAGSDGIACRPVENKRVRYLFDERDGVVSLTFNIGSKAILSNGDILFGTNHDFVVVTPDKALNFGPSFPQVQISGLSVNEEWLAVDSILTRGRLDLDYQQNSLTIRYTTNSFQSVYTMVYMLQGVDKDWKEVKSSGEVNLNYLAPGKYLLKAGIMRQDGKLSGIINLSINISPPFYKTWWFFVVIGLIICGQLYWLDHLRLKRKEDLQDMRTNIAGKLHSDVSTALGNINILSEMALLKADIDPSKSKEFIEQIQHKSSGTITAMEDMLWAISPNNDSMEKTAERMQEYVQAINNREQASIEMLIDDNVKNLKLDMQLRHQVFLLFKDSLAGLLDAGVSSCRVHVGYEKPVLLYLLEFGNAGCDMRQLNNFFQSREMASSLNAIHAQVQITVHKSSSEIECRISV